MIPSYKELQDYLQENNFPTGKQLTAKKHKEFIQNLKKTTEFLDYMGRIPNQLRCFVVWNNITKIPTCSHPDCNNTVSFSNLIPSVHGSSKFSYFFNSFCSLKCSHSSPETIRKRQETMMKNYGAPTYIQSEKGKKNFKEKIRENYGVDHPSQSPEVQKKKEQTMIERFGVDNNMKTEESKRKHRENALKNHGVEWGNQSHESRENTIQTVRERYGVDYITQTDQFKQKSKETLQRRYNIDHPMHSEEIRNRVIETSLRNHGRSNHTQKHISSQSLDILNDATKLAELYHSLGYMRDVADELSVSQAAVQRYIARHGIDIVHSRSSRKEDEVNEFVESLGHNTLRSSREVLKPLEADITVPERNLIIEFNGIYWHSEVIKDKYYHQNKTLNAHEKGYNIIHVWEDDWDDPVKQEIVKNKIRSKLGVVNDRVFARKCYIDSPPLREVKDFYTNNHIQGFVRATYHIGLRECETNELVACASFHRVSDGVFDLNRFATSKSVIGGFSKILSHFTKHVEWKKIFTFASLDYSNGSLYEQTGFARIHITPPNLWYIKGPIRERREQYMKHKLHKKLEKFDPTLTEKENMDNHGFERLFDSGSIKYELTNQ